MKRRTSIQSSASVRTAARPLDAAIVGMACRFPGAPDLTSYFENVLARRSRHHGNLDPVPFAPGSLGVYSATLDPADPASYLILDSARSALADAGLESGRSVGRKISLFAAMPIRVSAIADRVVSRTLGVLRDLHPDWIEADFEAIGMEMRLSGSKDAGIKDRDRQIPPDSMNLGAATLVNDSRASALIALRRAARSLRDDLVDVALVAGVSLSEPDVGVGVVVLKRLAEADRDGDRIYAVIKAIETSSIRSGRSKARGFQRAFRRAGIDPASIGLSDGEGLVGSSPLHVGQTRSRLLFPIDETRTERPEEASDQHRSAATVMAGLIKLSLAIHHRLEPPRDRENAEPGHDRAGESNGVEPTKPWFRGDSRSPRRAALGAIDPGRIGALAILEEHANFSRSDAPGGLTHWESEAILLGAEDRTSWLELAGSLLDWLDLGSDITLKDLAYTLNSGQPPFPFRVGFVASTADDLRLKLGSAIAQIKKSSCGSIRDMRGIYFWEAPLSREGSLAFLFPGEGSQYPGMLADLVPHFPEVSALFDTADRVARDQRHGRCPSDHLFHSGDPALWSMGTAINIVLSSQWALYQVLIRLGLRPSAVVGHSSGEFLALGASGVLRIDRRFEDGIGALGSVFEALDVSGSIPSAALLAVAGDRSSVESILSESRLAGVSIVIDNCPHQVVLAGPRSEIDRAAKRLGEARLICERLPFDRAYHSPSFEPAIRPVLDFLDRLDFRKPRVPLYSCSTAERMPDDPSSIRDLAAGQWARPVEFRKTVETMHANGVRIFVEVGARGNLTGFVDDILRGRPSFAVAANLPKRSGLTQLNHLVASLFAQGVAIRPDHLYARRRPSRIRFDVDPSDRLALPSLSIGVPEFHLSPDLLGRLAAKGSRPTIPALDSGPNAIDESCFAALSTDADPAIRAYARTMAEFLETQRAVLSAYRSRSLENAEAAIGDIGPWIGEIVSIVPGRELVSLRRLEIEGDLVAENHTLGGRRISAVEPGLKGLPVLPFAVMAEMLAEAAAVLMPGLEIVELRELTALRWVRYEEDRPVFLRIEASRSGLEAETVGVTITNLGSGENEGDKVLVFEGVARFAKQRPEPPLSAPVYLENARECRFDAEELYDDQWLFHGPAMTGLIGVGRSSPEGIEGTIVVRPRRELLGESAGSSLKTDAVALDVFTHLLGCWGLDQLIGGDVIFPLRLGSLEFFGDDPDEGEEVDCRIAVKEVDSRRVRVDAELVRDDGSTWMRLKDWEDWRFHWPSRFRDVFRAPDQILIGEPLEFVGARSSAVAVWLEPPEDFARPVWRDVLEWVQLGPEERRRHLAKGGTEVQRSLRLWGKIAAKEAVRRLWIGLGDESFSYPADLVIDHDSRGRPQLRSLLDPGRGDLPSISISHVEGVAVALATSDPKASPGIDVVRIEPRGRGFESSAFSAAEIALLDRVSQGDRDAWSARFWAAKEAAGKAIGIGLDGRPTSLEISDADVDSGRLTAIAPGCRSIPVETARRGEFAWGWTIVDLEK